LIFALITAAGAAQTDPCDPIISNVQPAAGPTTGGTMVTVEGLSLGGCCITSPCFPSFVFFGDTQADVIAAFPDHYVVRTPPHAAGTVDVTIIAFGRQGVRHSAFTFLDPSAIPSLSPTLLMLLILILGMVAISVPVSPGRGAGPLR
jgi:hypothetical protein